MKPPLLTHTQASAFDSPWPLKRRLQILLWHFAWPLLAAWTPKPANAWRLLLLRAFGATIFGRPFVHPRARIEQPWHLTLHHRSCLGDRANAYSLGPIVLHEEATVAQEAYLCTGTHCFSEAHLPLQTSPIVIGPKAFIGVRALILPGIHIEEGAVIGAGAIVTHNVPPWHIVAGNPARPLGLRSPSPSSPCH